MIHLALGTLLWLALLFLAREGRSAPLFFLVALAALFVWRAPLLSLDMELNRDESQMIAQAMKFRTDFLPWRSVDGGTGGPLLTYAIMWPYLFGTRVSYATERATELALLFSTIFFCWKACAVLAGERRALFAVFPLVTLCLFAHKPDFVQYCGEDLPVALLAAGAWLALELFKQPTPRRAFRLGLLLGAVPFAKLQAGPLAAYLFLAAAGAVRFRKPLAWLAGGTLCVPAAILVPVAAGGAWTAFVSRYILLGARLRYGVNPPSAFSTFAELLHRGGEVAYFLAGAGLWILIAALLQKKERAWLGGFALAMGYLLVGFFVVTRSSAIFRHYLLFLPVPATLAACWVWRGRTLLFAALCVLPVPLAYGAETLYYSFVHRPPGFNGAIVTPHAQYIQAARSGAFELFRLEPRFNYAGQPLGKVGANAVSRFLLQMAAPGDRMAMWGCMCRCFGETGMTPATRDAMGGFGLLKDDSYPAVFLADMKETKPRFFVDSARAEGLNPESWAPNEVRHADYPPLADYVSENYALVAEVRPETGGERVLIYERKH